MDKSRVIVELRGIIGDAALEARLRGNTSTSSDAERLDRVYLAVFGKRIVRTCGNCLYDAYIHLKINAKKDLKNMEERIKCDFVLKAGVILRVENEDGSRSHYSNANITDAVARQWLKEHPNTLNYFSSFPDGYLEELAAGKDDAAENAASPVAEEAPANTSANKPRRRRTSNTKR